MNHHRGKQSSKICFSIKCWVVEKSYLRRELRYRRLGFKIPWLCCSYWFIYFHQECESTLYCFNKNTFRHSNNSTNDNKSKMIYVIIRTFTMIECWCISIIFGNDLLVKLDNWFFKPFLGNTVSWMRRRREEERGNYWKSLAVSCNLQCHAMSDFSEAG